MGPLLTSHTQRVVFTGTCRSDNKDGNRPDLPEEGEDLLNSGIRMNTRSGARDQSSHSGIEPAQGGDSMAQLALLMSQMVNHQEARKERCLRLEQQKIELER